MSLGKFLPLYNGDYNASSIKARCKGPSDIIKEPFQLPDENIIVNIFVGLLSMRDYAKTILHITTFNLYKNSQSDSLVPNL